jgi:hypothetical protein
MSVVRIARRDRWAAIANSTLEDERLSFRARGILAWLLAKPDGWSVNSTTIAEHGTEGREAVRTALRELEEFGYMVREKVRCDIGQIVTVTTVYETPPGTGFRAPVDRAPVSRAPRSKNPEQEPTTPSPPAVGGGGGASPRASSTNPYSKAFEAAWVMYPRKVEKKAAWVKWQATLSRIGPTPENKRILITAVEHFAAGMAERDPDKIKHAATFFGPAEPWRDWVDGNPEPVAPRRPSSVDNLAEFRRRRGVS